MSVERLINKKGASYKVRLHNKNLLVKTKTFRTLELAKKWEIQELHKLTLKEHFPSYFSKVTIDEVFEKWIFEHAEIHKEKSSLVKDKQMYRDYISPCLGKANLEKINLDSIEGLKRALLKEGRLSPASINKVFQLLRTILNFAVSRRLTPDSPMRGFKFLRQDEQAFAYWTQDQVNHFLSYANSKYMNHERWIYSLYFVLLSTGLRIREATAISWDDVHIESNLIRIGSSYDRFEKKIKTRTKGGKTRFVPLNESLKVELLSLRNKRIGPQVFPHPRVRDQVVDADYFREFIFYRDAIESGLPKIKVHDLRHTFASNFLMSGGSLFDLQQILGHSSYEMTKRYAHLSKAHVAKQRSIIDFRISDLRSSQDVVALHPRVQTPGSELEKLGATHPPLESERGQDVFDRESMPFESVPSQILPNGGSGVLELNVSV